MKLYIDPGTGSMLFTVLIGLLGTGVYFLRNVFMKLRFLASGGARDKSVSENRMPYVIFADHKRYWNTFEPICDEFERRGEDLTYMTASPDDPALQKPYRHVKCQFIGQGNRAFAKLNFLHADILLSTTPSLDVFQWKRSKDVKWYVHVLHAPSDPVLYRMFGLDYYDAVLLSGAYQIQQQRALEQARHLPPRELTLIGLPYMDALKARLDAAPPLPAHPTTVLLAPSWGSNGILSRYGGKVIQALLDTGFHVIVRPHPQSFTAEAELMDRLMKQFPDSDALEWNRDNDNFEVLRRSDIMISDFSGVIFDYALVFQKPVIYTDTSFDRSPYDAWWLKEELWTFTTLPRIGRALKEEQFGQLRAIIDEMVNSEQYRSALEEARDETWVNIGRSASLVADYMMEKAHELADE